LLEDADDNVGNSKLHELVVVLWYETEVAREHAVQLTRLRVVS